MEIADQCGMKEQCAAGLIWQCGYGEKVKCPLAFETGLHKKRARGKRQ